jgi:RNA polymerase primary sigma factor
MTAIKKTKTEGLKSANKKSEFQEDVLSQYLHEISRVPLLTREEEEKFARAAAQGNKAARERLISGNLRFVINVAKKYQGLGLSLSDLISEGNVGLIQAVDKFKIEKGCHFISYAVWWIRQSILKAISEKARMIRLPQNRTKELIMIERAKRMVQDHQSIESEIREIAEMLDMGTDHIEDLINISKDIVSLDSPVHNNNEHDSSSLGDFVEDRRRPSPYHEMIQSKLEEDIESILDTFDKKEAEVIRYRYGLGKRPSMSLKDLGDRFNLTKERIRQIENKAILRLRHPIRMNKLAPYVA